MEEEGGWGEMKEFVGGWVGMKEFGRSVLSVAPVRRLVMRATAVDLTVGVGRGVRLGRGAGCFLYQIQRISKTFIQNGLVFYIPPRLLGFFHI